MIVWITAKAAGMPVDQRAEVLDDVDDTVAVRLCGTGERKHVNTDDIVGVEISKRLDIFFEMQRIRRTDVKPDLHPPLQCRAVKSENGVGLNVFVEGYGSATMENGHGTPLYLEKYAGTLQLYVWADINKEDPTHVIDLEGALESRRKEEP